ncbi:hypothetical protein [Rhizobium ruizarguesonis]
MALSPAKGTAHQATDGTVLFPAGVRWHVLPSLAFEEVQRQPPVVVIGPQFQLSAFMRRGDYVFRRWLLLPSPGIPERFMCEGREGSDFTTIDQCVSACKFGSSLFGVVASSTFEAFHLPAFDVL